MIATCGKKILLSPKQVLFVTEVFLMESPLSALVDEVAGVKLGDKRLTKRLAIIIDRLDAQPNLSIPAAIHGRNETEAAYRFFANDAVTRDVILSTHYAMTRRRISRETDCLLVQETTEVALTRPRQEVADAGPMRNDSQFGAFVQPLMAFTADGIPLGIACHKNWASALSRLNFRVRRTSSPSYKGYRRRTGSPSYKYNSTPTLKVDRALVRRLKRA